LIRSDHIGHLTLAGREALIAYGVTSVLDLRSPAELLKSPNPVADGAGPAYVNIPLIDDANMREVGEAADMYERYLMILDNRQEAFCGVFNAVADAEGPMVFHCFAGKDRTGLVAAILLAVAGVTKEAIVADFGETDAQLARRYEQWIADATPERRKSMRDELRCPPEWILGVLDHLDQKWGGVEGYLEDSGVSSTNIHGVSAKLV
jgi:protein tyrosine/serine phosphatase